MSGTKRKRKQNKKKFPWEAMKKLPTVLVVILLAAVFVLGVLHEMGKIDLSKYFAGQVVSEKAQVPEGYENAETKVHFIDVGQGDSIFIETTGKTILIDAGEREYGEKVTEYITDLGVKKIDIVIGTHPHSDHIGGLPQVLDSIEAGLIILPKIPDDMVPATKTYEQLLTVIANKQIRAVMASDTLRFDWSDSAGGQLSFEILGPLSDEYTDLNNFSVVSKLTYKDVSFLFTGDAEKAAEDDMLYYDKDVSATVLKMGHHGSSSSSSAAFLREVSPLAAVIQCGEGNSYGHPGDEALKRIGRYTERIYRTDERGTVVVYTDGATAVAGFERAS